VNRWANACSSGAWNHGELDKKLRLGTRLADGPQVVVGDPRDERRAAPLACRRAAASEVAAMNLATSWFRPKRRMVER